jgi:hypothetical protein
VSQFAMLSADFILDGVIPNAAAFQAERTISREVGPGRPAIDSAAPLVKERGGSTRASDDSDG